MSEIQLLTTEVIQSEQRLGIAMLHLYGVNQNGHESCVQMQPIDDTLIAEVIDANLAVLRERDEELRASRTVESYQTRIDPAYSQEMATTERALAVLRDGRQNPRSLERKIEDMNTSAANYADQAHWQESGGWLFPFRLFTQRGRESLAAADDRRAGSLERIRIVGEYVAAKVASLDEKNGSRFSTNDDTIFS